MTYPSAIASFPNLTEAPFNVTSEKGPFVFLGNDQISNLGTCYGTTGPYGNNVVSYGINAQP
jgi:hypothetical protein